MAITYYNHLPNKPLVETIFEVKWGELNRPDPAYPVIVGRLYERVRATYPVIEDLDLAQFPPSVAVQVARHRFRATANGWPLVQIGPGVATLNDTEGYSWQGFRELALEFLPNLRSAHPGEADLSISSLKLEYINAIDFDFAAADVREFLRDKLHVKLELPDALFEGQPLRDRPAHALSQIAFPTQSPVGRVQLTLSTGQREGRPAVIMQTSLQSVDQEAQEGWSSSERWLGDAHKMLQHWFFTLVQGDLVEGFLRS